MKYIPHISLPFLASLFISLSASAETYYYWGDGTGEGKTLTHAYFKQRLSLPVYCVIPLALDHKVECVAATYFRAVSSLQPALPA